MLGVSHPSRVRELKRPPLPSTYRAQASHPSRVRELKQAYAEVLHTLTVKSHPSRVRELKHRCIAGSVSDLGRTPPGCVN